MAIEEIIDSVRRIIGHWVNTTSPLRTDASIGDTTLNIGSTVRFLRNDEVMIQNGEIYETGLTILSVIDNNHIKLSSPIKFNWDASAGAVLIKTFNNMYIQGIYFGDPEVIPIYPAITVSGGDRNSQWLTLNSTTEKYNLDINVYVQDDTEESGYRFLLQTADTIQAGLKRNVFPIVNDFNTIGVAATILPGDYAIKVATTNGLTVHSRIFIENPYQMEDTYVAAIDTVNNVIYLTKHAAFEYDLADNPIIIVPSRLIYNSWPSDINYMKIHKNTLLKAATISWFAEEEEIQNMFKFDPQIQ